MKPIEKRKTTKEIVYERLKDAILHGDIEHKEVLTETYLADSLDTSRTPIREAVSDLVKEGLLTHIPRRGFRVREITEHEMDQIIYLRTSIEIKGVTLLASTITDEDVKVLNHIISQQEEAIKSNNRIEYIELDQLFHRKILRASHQNLLEQIHKELYNLTRLIGHAAITKEGRMEDVIEEHKNIVRALEEKDDLKASEYMKNHLMITGEIVKQVKDD
ncbi:GntR family transcriptional regulator [Oceanobacillus massiliensis]|uniref:GntR family transcriptional regulator n=1 Tax=Oceanobacillus massiliensis TaxID=1465765 RepID=UPI00028901E1|nr:GntR family transcriptional regulator [Oceanobacillus massiliensis]